MEVHLPWDPGTKEPPAGLGTRSNIHFSQVEGNVWAEELAGQLVNH